MLNENWGEQMMAALRAVRRMHADSSRLLLDLDRALPEFKSVYGSWATLDLSYDIKRANFMSEGLLRHWSHASDKKTVIAVNIAFWDDNADVTEPYFIAAKILYAEPLTVAPDRNKAWDPWYCYLNWTTPRIVNVLADAKPPEKRADIVKAASIGVPLSSVSSESRGHELLEAVQAYRFS